MHVSFTVPGLVMECTTDTGLRQLSWHRPLMPLRVSGSEFRQVHLYRTMCMFYVFICKNSEPLLHVSQEVKPKLTMFKVENTL
jgi:hypothetical protein